MKLLDMFFAPQVFEGETQSASDFLDGIMPTPKGSTKTGAATRFAVSVTVAGETKQYARLAYGWELMGFAKDYYGFGTRLQMQVARDGVAAFEHQGLVYIVAKVGEVCNDRS